MEQIDEGLQLTASVRPAQRQKTSIGGDFELRAKMAPAELRFFGGDFTVTVQGGGDPVLGGCGCLCSRKEEIFSDSFESVTTG